MLTILLALAYRWRGDGHLALGRLLCAGLVAAPVAGAEWPWGLAAWLPVAALSWAALCLPHNPNPKDLRARLLLTLTGLAVTLPVALALGAFGHWTAAAALAIAGLAKGLWYLLLPLGPGHERKFLWREFAFGAGCGLAGDAAILLILL